MYHADRVRETTTTTGTGTLTLAGAVAQHQTFNGPVGIGDQCEYFILDANGTGWQTAVGTLLTSTTLSRDINLDGSSGRGNAISLSAGTHQVVLTFSADRANKALVFGDVFLDYVVSGLVLPITSGSLAGTLSAGVAYVIGQRVVKGAQAHTYTASKDTYVDLNNVGLLTYSAVSNGAGAPALTSNSIRLGYVVTNGSVITSAVQTGKDSLGNWMYNTVRAAHCRLLQTVGQSIASATATAMPFAAGTEMYDNDGLHSVSVNNSRATVAHRGCYDISGQVYFLAMSGAGTCSALIYIDGLEAAGLESSGYSPGAGTYVPVHTGGKRILEAGQYVELFAVHTVTGSQSMVGELSLTRVG